VFLLVQNTAKQIYLKFENTREKFTRSQTDGIIAAILYLACKQEGYPRTLKRIAFDTGVHEKNIRIGLQLMGSKQDPMAPEDLVPWICSQLKVEFVYEAIARKIARCAFQVVEGKHPDSIASACVYLVCSKFGLSVRDNEIADAAMVALATLRNVVRELHPHRDLLFAD